MLLNFNKKVDYKLEINNCKYKWEKEIIKFLIIWYDNNIKYIINFSSGSSNKKKKFIYQKN